MRTRRALEAALLAALALVSLVPLIVALRLADRSGGVFAGSDGPFPADQFQYMAWIRELGTGLLAANQLDIAPSDRVFFHPMFFLSGLAWKAGFGMPLAYMLWKPVALAALFFGFRAYVGRFLGGLPVGLPALALALFFAAPAGAIAGWAGLGSAEQRSHLLDVAGEALPAALTWGYLPAAISVGLLPVFLLLAERLVRRARAGDGARGRDVALAAACGAAVSWLHPWQGQVALLTVLGAVALARFARPHLVLLVPLAGLALPLGYYFVLSKADTAWSYAAEANAAKGQVPLWAIALALAPLALAAAPALRSPGRDFGERTLWLWPLAALLCYLALTPSFPQHAFEGVSLPLAVLAGRWATGLDRPLLASTAIAAVLTLPGLVYMADWVRDTINADVQAHYLRPGEERALDHLDDGSAEGGVLTRLHLGALVPAETGRQTWVGHPSWTRDFDRRVRRAEALFGGRLSPAASAALVRSSRARFLLADCGAPGRHLERLPVLAPVRRFGCASVYRVRGR